MIFNLLATETAAKSTSSFSMIIMLVVMVALMYFVMIRPQKKNRLRNRSSVTPFRSATRSQLSAVSAAELLP